MNTVLPEVVGRVRSLREKIQYHDCTNEIAVRTGHGAPYGARNCISYTQPDNETKCAWMITTTRLSADSSLNGSKRLETTTIADVLELTSSGHSGFHQES